MEITDLEITKNVNTSLQQPRVLVVERHARPAQQALPRLALERVLLERDRLVGLVLGHWKLCFQIGL